MYTWIASYFTDVLTVIWNISLWTNRALSWDFEVMTISSLASRRTMPPAFEKVQRITISESRPNMCEYTMAKSKQGFVNRTNISSSWTGNFKKVSDSSGNMLAQCRPSKLLDQLFLWCVIFRGEKPVIWSMFDVNEEAWRRTRRRGRSRKQPKVWKVT